MTKTNKKRKRKEKKIQKHKRKKIQKLLGNIVRRKSGLSAANGKMFVHSRWVTESKTLRTNEKSQQKPTTHLKTLVHQKKDQRSEKRKMAITTKRRQLAAFMKLNGMYS
jgi:hypothetical protein